MKTFFTIALVVGGVIAAVVLLRQRSRANTHYDELVSMCRGDRAQADRLVAGQKQRHPDVTDQEAARRAVMAWRRDMR